MSRISIAFLLLLLSIPAGFAATGTARVVKLDGSAALILPGDVSQPLSVGSAVAVGSRIKTGANGTLMLVLVPGAFTIIKPNSDVTITALDFEAAGNKQNRKVAMKVATGDIVAKLEKAPGDSSYEVSTPQGVAAAKGTAFEVTVNGQKMTVSVVEGNVSVTLPNGQVFTVPTGNSGTVEGEGASASQTSNSPMTAEQAAAVAGALEAVGFTVTSTVNANGTITYTVSSPGNVNPGNFTMTPTPSPAPTPGSTSTPAPTPNPTPTPPEVSPS